MAGSAPTPAAAGNDREPLELAAGYRLLSELFAAEPDEELLALAATMPALARHATGEAARRYTDVFVINAYPFASVYLEPDGAIDGERAGFIRGVLETLGLEADPSVAADHIAVLLAALAALLEREAAAADALQIERARHAQRALLAGHLLPWAPHFLDAVKRVDDGLYRAAATLARRLLREHSGALFAGRANAPAPRASGVDGDQGRGAHPASTSAPDRSRVQADPGADASPDAKALLMQLVGPARCGFFLCRADIVGLAAELGLGIRFGG
ncbi:MAG: molecular chaperone TorD family protein, partial [Deinococcales bacterium]